MERAKPMRPLRDLLARLPLLPVSCGDVDFKAADASLLVSIGDDAEVTLQVIHHGVGCIGQLLSHSAPVIEDGTVSADTVEHLGYLMAELGDMAASLMTLAAHCRQQTLDWTGMQSEPPVCRCQSV